MLIKHIKKRYNLKITEKQYPVTRLLFIVFFVASYLMCQTSVFAQQKENPISFKAKYDGEKILFRWAPKNLDLNNTYKLYKLSGKKEVLIGTYQKVALEKIAKTVSPEQAKLITALLYPQSLYKSDTRKLEALSQKDNQKGMAFFLAELKPEVAKATGLWAEDAEVEKNGFYAYVLKAYKNGNKIAEKGVSISTSEKTRLYPPEVTSRRYEWGCALRWTNFDYYTAFNIYRGTRDKGKYTKINQSPVSVNYIKKENGMVETPPYFYSDTTTDKAQPVYYYKVTGIDSFGDESPQSLDSFAIRDSSLRPAPQKPVVTTIAEPDIHISWSKDESEKIKGFNLFRSSQYNGTYKKVNTDLITKTLFVDNNVKYKINYFYCHTAVDINGNESVMSLPRLAVLRDRTPPATPRNLQAVARKGAVELTWLAVTDKDLDGYEIYRASSPTAPDWAMLNKGAVTSNRFTDSMAAVFDKKPYYYKVLAKDTTANRSGWSNIIEIKLPDVTPPKRPVWVGAKSIKGALLLEWKASASKDLKGYKLYKGRGNKQALIADVPKDKLTYTDKTAKPGQKVWYFLTAVDGDKNESEKSTGLEAVNKDTTPVSLKNLSISYTPNGVLIELNTKDTDFKTMTVERKNTLQKKLKKIAVNHRLDSYLDKFVDKNKTYTYKLTAYDRSGNVSVSSEINVKTK